MARRNCRATSGRSYDTARRLLQSATTVQARQVSGPGTELHGLIRQFFGQDYAANCGCENMVRKMNAWGPDGCREHMDEIVDKMIHEGKKRKLLASSLPGARLVAKRVVSLAIRRSGEMGSF